MAVDNDEIDSIGNPEFDISWRPKDYDSPEVMDLLLDIGETDLNAELLRSAAFGHSETMDVILSRLQWNELESATDSLGMTALQIARSKNHEDIVQMILSKRPASVEPPTTSFRPPGPPEFTEVSRVEFAPNVMSPGGSSTDLSTSTDPTTPPRSVSPRIYPRGRSVGRTLVSLSRQLTSLIARAEDLASVLLYLLDYEPVGARREVTDITGAIGELYRLSMVLQQLRDVYEASRYEHRLYRIETDARLVCRSAQRSMDLALDMVGQASEVTRWMVWDDLAYRMETVERMPLLTRLKCYYSFTQGLLDQLEGYQFDGTLVRIKDNLLGLEQQQRGSRPDILPCPVKGSQVPDTPTPLITMPTSRTPRVRRSVADYSDPAHLSTSLPKDCSLLTRPNAPPPPTPGDPPPSSRDPPRDRGDLPYPTNSLPKSARAAHSISQKQESSRPKTQVVANPTATQAHGWSGVRHTFGPGPPLSYGASSATLVENRDPSQVHWTSYIFRDNRWRSRYRATSQVNAATRCKGSPQVDAKFYLNDEGFIPLESVTFSDNGSIITFYRRPRDGRASLLFTAIDLRGQETYYCTPLNCLRAIRDDSILKLCMARSHEDRAFWPWAELKFIYHERMVLFYSTFVALKRQSLASVPQPLIEDPRDMEEDTLFSGTIRDREMYHALRLLRDPGSGVLRLEARSYRGDKEEVPIWTAFLSKYRDNRDRDIFNLEGNGIVSMICPKPKSYIFVQEYRLPCMSNGDFALQFSKRDDAKDLIEVWTGLCAAGRRS